MGLRQLVKAEKEQFHCNGNNATSIITLAKIFYVLTFHFNTKQLLGKNSLATYLLNSTKLKPMASMQGRAERHQMYILILKCARSFDSSPYIDIYFHRRDAKEACIYSLARCQKPNTLLFDTNPYCWVVKSLAKKSAENKTVTKFILIFPFSFPTRLVNYSSNGFHVIAKLYTLGDQLKTNKK